MAVRADELESEEIDAVCRAVHDRLPDGQAALAEAFIRQYYRWVPAADLAGRTTEDLLGAALAHLNHASIRSPQEAKVRVFNPGRERDGFESPYTVIQIVSDDMPFIVDSVTMELGSQDQAIELAIHPVIWVRRDDDGRLLEVRAPDADTADAIPESVLSAEVTRESDPARLQELGQSLHRVLGEVRAVVEDWQDMGARARELADELRRQPPPLQDGEVEEGAGFLEWTAADHFTFLGYREYELSGDGSESTLRAQPETGLGILRGAPASQAKMLRGRAAELAHTPYLLVLTKANSRSTVHRPAHLDYIGVKQFGAEGQVTGERRFLGLYTTAAYRTSPFDTPVLKRKVSQVLERSGFPEASHDCKALVAVLESYPRDALLQIDADDLFRISMGLLRLGERPRVRLF